jgi:hypothetical protein
MWILFNFIRGKVLPIFCKYTPGNIKSRSKPNNLKVFGARQPET